MFLYIYIHIYTNTHIHTRTAGTSMLCCKLPGCGHLLAHGATEDREGLPRNVQPEVPK